MLICSGNGLELSLAASNLMSHWKIDRLKYFVRSESDHVIRLLIAHCSLLIARGGGIPAVMRMGVSLLLTF